MLMEKWIVLEGDVVSGLEFYGPFNTHNDATSFAYWLNGYNRVVKLKPTPKLNPSPKPSLKKD